MTEVNGFFRTALRDADYYVFSTQKSIDYSLGGFTVVFGVKHESTNWGDTTAYPTIAPTPAPGNHAVYWNVAFTELGGGLQAQGSFDSSLVSSTGYTPNTVDPLGVIWAQGFGTSAGCASLHSVNGSIGCSVPFPTYTGGKLSIIQRVYANPLTGVYPSPITVLPATVVHFSPPA